MQQEGQEELGEELGVHGEEEEEEEEDQSEEEELDRHGQNHEKGETVTRTKRQNDNG